tara:strand:- start:2800 stop:4737 length:1938 start_codon:yes stop_codon:yes gene_type:complete
MKDTLLITFHKITLLLILVFSFTVLGQEEVYFLDDKIKGRAYYDFANGNGQMTGTFYFESFKQDTIDPSIYYKYSLKGRYKEGLKDGTWRYDFKELTPIGDLHIDSIGFKESAEGKQRSIIGQFDQGEMTGNWKVLETYIDFSRIVDTTLHYDLTFDEDSPVGNILIKQEDNLITGSIDDQGFVYGDLTFKYEINGSTIVDRRTYDHGRMIEARLTKDGEIVSRDFTGFEIPAKNDEDYVTLEMNDTYLNAILLSQDIKTEGSGLQSEFLIRETDELLYEAIRSTKNHGDISLWPESPELIFPKIKLALSKNSTEQEEQVALLAENFDQFKQRLKKVLRDEQVEIIANANEDIARYQSIYEALSLNYKDFYEPVVKAIRQPGAKYLNTNVLIDHILGDEQVFNDIKIKNGDEKITIPFEEVDPSQGEVQQINVRIKSLLKFMDATDQTVEEVLSLEKKRLSLSDEEKEMVELRDSVHLLFEKPTENEFIRRFDEKVISQVDEEFSNYANLELSKKLEKLDDLTSCFRSFIEFYQLLDEMPQQRRGLDSLYTRTVWNPFTYTDMDEIVKEKMYNAFDKVLFPHLMDQVEEQISCATIDKVLHDIPRVIERMEELRNVDTKDLEKELRRENDPMVVEEVLKMDLQLF